MCIVLLETNTKQNSTHRKSLPEMVRLQSIAAVVVAGILLGTVVGWLDEAAAADATAAAAEAAAATAAL